MFFSRFLQRRRIREQELEEEIQVHLRMAAKDRIDKGESSQDAMQSAKRELGNTGLVKEVTREMWGWASFERLGQDLRYAFRVVRNSPGFAVVAILSMALGIGANTAIFSLIDAVMLQSLPVRNPSELVMIGDPTRIGGRSEGGGRADLLSYPFYARIRQQNQVFSDVYASGRSEHLDVALPGGPSVTAENKEAPRGRFVSGNFFEVLGVPAFIGRTFTQQEVSVPGAAPVVVISYGYWERQFGRNPGIVGQNLRINGSSFTVMGVAAREFFGDVVGAPTDIWFPITMQAQANPGHDDLKQAGVSWLLLMGHLKPGISQAQADAAVNVLAPQLFRELYKSIDSNEGLQRLLKTRVQVSSGAKGFSRIRHDFSLPLLVLMGTVALVLLICCANVANLQLTRAINRHREMGLRLAVGAGQARLIRQLLTESLMLSIAGGCAGLLFAFWGTHVLLKLVSQDGRVPMILHLDARVLLFTAGVSILSGLLFGLAPALRATSVDLISSLKESKSGPPIGVSQIFSKSLLVCQIVLSVMLLAGAGLFIRTLQNLEKLDVGYAREGLLLVQVDSKTGGYKDAQVNQLSTDLLERLKQIPGVSAVSVSENGLFSGTDSETNSEIEGYIARSYSDRLNRSDRVGPNYFEVVGTPVILGRGITPGDNERAPKVAVINEKMARFYFPHSSPLGRHIFDGDGKDRIAITIVGVVRDAKERELRQPTARRFYTAYLQHRETDPIEDIVFELRTSVPSVAVAESARRQIRNFNSNLPVLSMKTADELIDDTLGEERLVARLSSFFGAVALALAAIGLYGVLSYLVVRRTTEIGIRLALGAEKSTVLWMVFKDAFGVVVAGLVLGIFGSILAARLFGKLLFGLSGFDPTTMLGACLVMAIAAAAAACVPAWRTSRVDPVVALRYE